MPPVPLIQCFPCGSVRGVQETVLPSTKPQSILQHSAVPEDPRHNPISPCATTSSLLIVASSVLYTEDMLKELCYEVPAVLQAIIADPQNQCCADCGVEECEWASIGFGTIICMNCAGFHRSLGTHLTSVRSIRLDTWTDRQMTALKLGGNQRFRSYCKMIFETTASIDSHENNEAMNTTNVIEIDEALPSNCEDATAAVVANTEDYIPYGLQVYKNPRLLYYSEVLRAELDERAVEEYNEKHWIDLSTHTPDPYVRAMPPSPIFSTAEHNRIPSPPGSTASTPQLGTFTHGLSSKSQSPTSWMADTSSKHCTICTMDFTLLRRRHHCRRCGSLVCNDCAPKENSRPIMEWGLKDPVRHCKNCYRSPMIEWK